MDRIDDAVEQAARKLNDARVCDLERERDSLRRWRGNLIALLFLANAIGFLQSIRFSDQTRQIQQLQQDKAAITRELETLRTTCIVFSCTGDCDGVPPAPSHNSFDGDFVVVSDGSGGSHALLFGATDAAHTPSARAPALP